MTSPQKEYGSFNDPVLVPTSLLVYRRFRLNYEGKLISMTSEDSYSSAPFDVMTGRFTAQCRKRFSPVGFMHSVFPDEIEPGTYTTHSAPQVGCECGYYAHYSPNDNFFPDSKTFSDRAWHVPMGTLFGAVEVSGRTVCGSRGVRAEKMRIRALSFDWNSIVFFDGRSYFDVVAQWTDYLQACVEKYGVDAYATKEAIIKAFPQPDISDLLKKRDG